MRFDVGMDAGQLDAVSAVLGAIAASAGTGAGDAVKDMTKASITGTRDRLISAVRRRLKKDPIGDAKLTVYAAEPTTANGESLHGHLVDADLEQDDQILTLARELIAAAGPAAMAPGSVAAQVINVTNTHGGTGFIGGHHVHQYQPANQTALADLYMRADGLSDALTAMHAAGRESDIASALIAKREAAESALTRHGHLLEQEVRDALRAEQELLGESQAYLAGTRMGLTWTGATEHLIPIDLFPRRVGAFANQVADAFRNEMDRVGQLLR